VAAEGMLVPPSEPCGSPGVKSAPFGIWRSTRVLAA
jgi:hypothetical protein